MDLIVFSHLRWDFVYQRPQHVLSRFGARGWNVFFVEEPLDGAAALSTREVAPGVTVVRTSVPAALPTAVRERQLRDLLRDEWRQRRIERPVLWFYTPMALPLGEGLEPAAIVYDCMDELSAFLGANELLPQRESELLEIADLVFTGGRRLYEAKRGRHPAVHCFPSSVDAHHFMLARGWRDERPDQAGIPRPRLGYFGVIDERFDIELIDGMARLSPGWSYVMVGPVVKIDPAVLPHHPNIHYLGPKSYADLPAYIATWDVALIPFARNEATRYISPTKVLEYMAAGTPIVSTSIADIVTPYGERRLVRIADRPFFAVAAAVEAMSEHRQARLEAFDRFLAGTSWDGTVREMERLVLEAAGEQQPETTSIATAAD
ncbi:MAG TPA: glycosyltransferase [Candidatus Limnocylindria bacterium]|nr:glycosyltransferase [Candidatus Limnocylindria bacterium]